MAAILLEAPASEPLSLAEAAARAAVARVSTISR